MDVGCNERGNLAARDGKEGREAKKGGWKG